MSRGYLDTVARLEPEIYMIDAAAANASIAISLKRIADSLQRIERHLGPKVVIAIADSEEKA